MERPRISQCSAGRCGCSSHGTGPGCSLGDKGSREVKLAQAPASLCAEFRIPNLPDTVHGSAASRFATPVHLAGIYELDLPRLAAELQDWYNRISQIWAAKELCQSFLTGNQPHRHTTSTPDPSTFWGETAGSIRSPVIYLKLRKRSPYQHPPAPGSSKE